MSHQGPSSSLAPLAAIASRIAASGDNLAISVKEYQHQNQNFLDISLRKPEVAFGPLSFWIILALLGIGILPLEFILLSMVDIEVALIGCSLFATSVVGLSTHVSAYYNDPRYNLGKLLKAFMANHKFLTLCAGAGMLMLNPLATIMGFSIGILVDITLYGLLNEIEVQSRRFFDWTVHTLTLENAENFMRYCWRHPLNLVSMALGAGSALKTFTHFFPQIFPMLFNFTLASFNKVQDLAADLTANLPRGFIPYYIISALAAVVCLVALPATLFTLPAIGVVGGGFFGLKIWDTAYNLMTSLAKKIHTKIKPPRRELLPALPEPQAAAVPAPRLAEVPAAVVNDVAEAARPRAPAITRLRERRYPLRHPAPSDSTTIAGRTRSKAKPGSQ